MPYRRWLFAILLFLSVNCALVPLLFARAGGGGGGGGDWSGSSGGGDSGVIFYLVYELVVFLIRSGPVGWAILAVLAVGGVIFYVYAKKNVSFIKQAPKIAGGVPVQNVKGFGDFQKNNPDFNYEAFRNKATFAFTEVQKAWSAADLSGVRRFLSDGVYQRFNTQFKMMALLRQKNPVSNVSVSSVFLDRIESDGAFDILHVGISAGMYDQFVCESNPALNSPGGYGTFTEFWSFVRKRGAAGGKDIYASSACPSCGGALPKDMGETGKCAYCGAFVNSGEYDWVLSEITQFDDYRMDAFVSKRFPNLGERVRGLLDENADFCVQQIEDKASNGYLQILTAVATKNPAVMRRFATDAAFGKFKQWADTWDAVFNRLFLNNVTLIGVKKDGNKNVLMVGVKASCQRARLSADGRAELLDAAMLSRYEVVFMERDAGVPASKGSLYAHLCSSCGAPAGDSLDIKCGYCGAALNSMKNEWIISDIMDADAFAAYYQENAREMDFKLDTSFITDLYNVRDFALNNMMVMIAADGVFAEKERAFADALAKKWGYNTANLKDWFEQARAGRMTVRMPQDRQKAKKIYELMDKTARIDEDFSPQEEALLNQVRDQYLKE